MAYIGEVTITDDHRGDRVMYIPPQAERDETHADCQIGLIEDHEAFDKYVQVSLGMGSWQWIHAKYLKFAPTYEGKIWVRETRTWWVPPFSKSDKSNKL